MTGNYYPPDDQYRSSGADSRYSRFDLRDRDEREYRNNDRDRRDYQSYRHLSARSASRSPRFRSRSPPRRSRSRSPRRKSRSPPHYSRREMYSFRGDSNRTPTGPRIPTGPRRQEAHNEYRHRDSREDYRNGREDFSFRSDRQTRFSPLPPADRDAHRRTQFTGGRSAHIQRRVELPRARNPYQAKARVSRAANDRTILHAQVDREATPERLTGMSEAPHRFKDVQDLPGAQSSKDMGFEDGEIDDEQSKNENNHLQKRVKRDGPTQDGSTKPKWSNPDPYTVLPPVDKPSAKKDVVDFIRNAKLPTTEEERPSRRNDVADNVDFISFGMGQDEDDAMESGGDEQSMQVAEVKPEEESSRMVEQTMGGSLDEFAASHAAAPPTGSSNYSHMINHHEYLKGKTARPFPSQSIDTNSNVSGPVIDLTTPPREIDMTQEKISASLAGRALFKFPARKVPESVPPTVFDEYRRKNSTDANPPQANQEAVDSSRRMTAMAALQQSNDSLPEVKSLTALQESNDRLLQAKAPKGQRSTRKRKPDRPTGVIKPEWQAPTHGTATPWCTEDHSATENMGYWLHKEICDFYEFTKPRDFETAVRQNLVDRISEAFKKTCPGMCVQSFGSFASGIYLPTADMDVVLLSYDYIADGWPQFKASHRSLKQFMETLCEAGIAASVGQEIIIGAKVPIIKFIDRLTGLKVDISFENMSGLYAVGTFANWKAKFPALPILVTLVKHFLLMRGLNEVYLGGVGGFAVTCLVVSLLQNMPAVQSGNMKPEHNLGEIFLRFLDFYGNEFNMNTTGIELSPPGYFTKEYRAAKWFIVDPNNENNDISGGSNQAPLIAKRFSEAHTVLQNHMATLSRCGTALRQGQSLLGPIFAGNYESFDVQRASLREVFDALFN